MKKLECNSCEMFVSVEYWSWINTDGFLQNTKTVNAIFHNPRPRFICSTSFFCEILIECHFKITSTGYTLKNWELLNFVTRGIYGKIIKLFWYMMPLCIIFQQWEPNHQGNFFSKNPSFSGLCNFSPLNWPYILQICSTNWNIR